MADNRSETLRKSVCQTDSDGYLLATFQTSRDDIYRFEILIKIWLYGQQYQIYTLPKSSHTCRIRTHRPHTIGRSYYCMMNCSYTLTFDPDQNSI